MSKKQIIKEDNKLIKPVTTSELLDLIKDNDDIHYQIAIDEDGEEFLIIEGWPDVKKIQQMIDPAFDSEDDTSLIDKYNWGFADEWAVCDNCGALIRTEPDSYSFVPDYWYSEKDGILCGDCVRNKFASEYLQSLVNNFKVANTILSEDELEYNGFTLVSDEFESGFYDKYDSPEELLKNALAEHPTGEFIFSITSQGQFATKYKLWALEESLENYDEEEVDESLKESDSQPEEKKEEDDSKDWGIWQGVEQKYYKHFMIPVVIGFIHIDMTKEEAEAKVEELRAEAEAHRAEFNLKTPYLAFKVAKPTEKDKEKYHKDFAKKEELTEDAGKYPHLQKVIDELNAPIKFEAEEIESMFDFVIKDKGDVLLIHDENYIYTLDYAEDMGALLKDASDEFGTNFSYKEDTIMMRLEKAAQQDFSKDSYIEWENSSVMVVYKDVIKEALKEALENSEGLATYKFPDSVNNLFSEFERLCDENNIKIISRENGVEVSGRFEDIKKVANEIGYPVDQSSKVEEGLKEEKESSAFTKDEVNKYVKELTQQLFDEGGYYDIWAEDDKIKAQIEWGDWKYNHLEFKTIVQHYFDNLNIKIKIDSEILEEDEMGIYTALHTISKA